MSAAAHKILKCKHGIELLQGTTFEDHSNPTRLSESLASYDKRPLMLKLTCKIFYASVWNAPFGQKLFHL